MLFLFLVHPFKALNIRMLLHLAVSIAESTKQRSGVKSICLSLPSFFKTLMWYIFLNINAGLQCFDAVGWAAGRASVL